MYLHMYTIFTLVWDICTYISRRIFHLIHIEKCTALYLYIYIHIHIQLIYMGNLHSKYVHWMYEHRIYVLNNIQIFFITPRLTPATNQILLNKLFKLYARLGGYRHQKGFYKNCQDWKYFTWKKEKGLFLGNTLYS